MIDPFTVITLASSFATGQKLGGLLSDWAYGKNIGHFKKGQEFLSKGVERHDSAFIKKAVSEFDYINEDDDRLFIVALSYLFLAICYTYLLEFSLAYDYLDQLEAIDYDFFTRKKDTIEEIKTEGRNFRPEVKKLERAMESGGSGGDDTNAIDWKKVSIVLFVVLGIGLIVALLLLLL